ncbi:MAG TPA: lyase family protein [Spirochaetota bacterium]|nr:lyase family protein [Spirochaetota bacterium]HQE59094.1 lyase family protein [Spirochaetota bacterium]
MKYYSHETEKAAANFGIGLTDPVLIKSYAKVKHASLSAVQKCEKRFSADEFSSLTEAILEIESGMMDDSFILALEQGGAGTSINMNINEVIASRASEILLLKYSTEKTFHYIDDINRFQSTNDTFPTAITIAVLEKLTNMESKVISFQHALKDFENKYHDVLLTGRTELQNALPVFLSQITAAWTGPIERDRWRIHKLKERLRTVPLGGTAIGTSFPATRDYIFEAEKYLREYTGLNLSRSQNFSDDISNHDKFAECASVIKITAQNIYRICADISLYTSSLCGEMIHPELQFGSTIMAAKTNPVICEFASGLAIDIEFECDKVSRYSELSVFQLNAYLPFIYSSLSNAFEKSSNALTALSEKLLPKLEINRERTGENLYSSGIMLNLFLPYTGYDRIKELYHKAKETKIINRDSLINFLKKEGIDETIINEALNPNNFTTARK